MKLLIPDASVAVKWCLPVEESLVSEAVDLLAHYLVGRVDFLVPDLFWAEFGNVMSKAVRQRRCSLAKAEESIRTMKEWQFPTVPSEGLLERALGLAHQQDRSFYDSLYVSLALSRQATLITADERLANSLAARFPVKWLGAFSIV